MEIELPPILFATDFVEIPTAVLLYGFGGGLISLIVIFFQYHSNKDYRGYQNKNFARIHALANLLVSPFTGIVGYLIVRAADSMDKQVIYPLATIAGGILTVGIIPPLLSIVGWSNTDSDSDVTVYNDEINNKYIENVEKWATDIVALNQTIGLLQREVDALEQQLKERKTKIDYLEEQAQSARLHIKTLITQYKDVRAKNTKLTSEIQRLLDSYNDGNER